MKRIDIFLSVAAIGLLLTTCSANKKHNTEPKTIELIAERQAVDIIREDNDANSKLVYLKFTNNAGSTHTGLQFVWKGGGKDGVREIGDIRGRGETTYDALWVPQSATSVTGTLKNGNNMVLWSGSIAITPAPRSHVIPKSAVYGLSQIKYFSLRGINYYPRYTPWSAWTSQKESDWVSEIAEISQLNVNAIRTFAECGEKDRKPGTMPSPEYLETISNLFTIANAKGIKTMMCLHSGLPSQVMADNIRFVRTYVETFQNDGRVLAWDLMNEVDDKGLGTVEYITKFCQVIYPRLSEWDVNHLNSIGFAYMLEKAVATNLTFNGPNQCWQYHFYRTTSADKIQNWKDNFFKDRPFIAGEFGDTSLEGASDAPRPYTGEKWQRDVYQSWFATLPKLKERGDKLLGIFAWTAFEFPKAMNVQPSGQGEYGLIRENGQLKPAGQLLKDEYAKLKKSDPAQWDK